VSRSRAASKAAALIWICQLPVDVRVAGTRPLHAQLLTVCGVTPKRQATIDGVSRRDGRS
jgi:hypothetical protein